jgi:hypothetical protein
VIEVSVEVPKAQTDQVYIRPMREKDVNFIIASWLNNYKESPFGKRITKQIYFTEQQNTIKRILQSEGVSVAVACNPEDHDFIYGYLVTEATPEMPSVHYAFVKATFQKFGIAKIMMKASGIDPHRFFFTHWTPICHDYLERHPECVYNPWKAWR